MCGEKWTRAESHEGVCTWSIELEDRTTRESETKRPRTVSGRLDMIVVRSQGEQEEGRHYSSNELLHREVRRMLQNQEKVLVVSVMRTVHGHR